MWRSTRVKSAPKAARTKGGSMPKARSIPFAVILLALSACASPEPEVEVVVVTATPVPATETPTATATSSPLPPSPTFLPTSTPEPDYQPIPIGAIESALRDAGYSRYPFTTANAVHGYTWVKESIYERTTTWETGAIELQVLHDSSSGVRADHMDLKLEGIAAAFPADFMSALRGAFDAYNQSVNSDVSGDPDEVLSLGGDWQDVWAQYYVADTSVRGYMVLFSVWWWQTTCPPQYLYCYFEQFPGLEFTGDSSFKFLSIYLEPPSITVPSSST